MKDSTSTLQTTGRGRRPWPRISRSSIRRSLWPLYRRRLQRSKQPVLIGPWRGELGFEALYWMPWVRALGLDPARMYVITRGGMAALYGAAHGFELFEMRTPQALRVENNYQREKTGKLKQEIVSAWDRAVLADAAHTVGLTDFLVLHPAWMYADCGPFLDGWQGLAALNDRLAYARLPPPPLPEGLTLPREFVAVRFYARYTFPYHPAIVEVATDTIRQLAAQLPVVMLHPGVHADEHVDLVVQDIPNVVRLHDLTTITPANNLLVQAAVLARAAAFVGTYGGTAQLALRFGVPSVSFYHEWKGTAMAHKHLSDGLALQMGVPFQVYRLSEVPLAKAVLPMVTMGISSRAEAAARGSDTGAGRPAPATAARSDEGDVSADGAPVRPVAHTPCAEPAGASPEGARS